LCEVYTPTHGRLDARHPSAGHRCPDSDRDSVSQPDEVAPLAIWGITALSVQYVSDDEDPDVLASSVDGVRFTDGSVRPTYDVLLHAH
jgi:hypothetical protein